MEKLLYNKRHKKRNIRKVLPYRRLAQLLYVKITALVSQAKGRLFLFASKCKGEDSKDY